MASNFEELRAGNFYHIYNRGINSCNLFEREEDYEKFLSLQERYIEPIADIYAWVLMPNHFHLLVRIKEQIIYKLTNADRCIDPVGFRDNKWETVSRPDGVKDPSENEVTSALKGKIPSSAKHFSHHFNAYAKYYNTKYKRHGALFERPFKRKPVETDDYLKQLIIYIHNNPKHHSFVETALEYPWSSYMEYLSGESTIFKDGVSDYFGDIDNFKACHQLSSFDGVLFEKITIL